MAHELIRRELWIDAPVENVWRFVGSAEGLRRWWGTEITLEPETGGRCEESVWEDGKLRRMRGVVTAYEPPQHLSLTWQADAEDDTRAAWPALTTVSITLAQEEAGTRVTLVHRAFGDVTAFATDTLPREIPLPQPVAPPHRREIEALFPGARGSLPQKRDAALPRQPGPEEFAAAAWRRRGEVTLDERIARLSGLFPKPVDRRREN